MGRKSEAKCRAVKQNINSLTITLDRMMWTLDKLRRVWFDLDKKRKEREDGSRDPSLDKAIQDLVFEFYNAKESLQPLVPRASQLMVDSRNSLLDFGTFLSHKAQKYASPKYVLKRKSLEAHQQKYVDFVPKLDEVQKRFDTFSSLVSRDIVQ